ncbi:MAG: succinate dehydrogenase [Rhodocyclales bacterium]|nr:succinate dehydrogenase [Rhodocyclales bacterium]
MSARREALLWLAQRASAMLLAACVLLHLATMVYAVRSGLSAAAILGRTGGNLAWAAAYATFVLAVAVHAPLGLRSVCTEWFGWRGRAWDAAFLGFGLLLALAGWRAVWGVFQ